MKKSAILVLGCGLLLSQFVHGAEDTCQALPSVEGDALVAAIASAPAGQFLQIDFDQEQVCILDSGAFEVPASGASFHVSQGLDELAVQATVEGFETWLRVDSQYGGELLLDRVTAEDLDLTAAEFLGDNSQLEASDFFVEFVGSLQVAELALRNVETEIPLLEVPYDHYSGRAPKPGPAQPEVEFLTTGSLGEEILEDLIITLDIENRRLYVMEAR